jgi:DNA helicase-2/ATP-dependent DNA helicase PcrA
VSDAIAADGALSVVAGAPGTPAPEDPHVAAVVLGETGIDLAALDGEIATLVAEAEAAARAVVEVELPPTLSATEVMRLRDDPDAFARDLARPMPPRPSATARFGTRFHRWVESRAGQQSFLDPMDLPGRLDADIEDEQDLARLKEAFLAGPFGDRVPLAVEWPFTVLLAGQSVSGRIDAVYQSNGEYEVVDWKTGRREDADPLQLAMYRLAWAEAHALPVERVTAAFHYVRSGQVVRPHDLPDRPAIEAVMLGQDDRRRIEH